MNKSDKVILESFLQGDKTLANANIVKNCTAQGLIEETSVSRNYTFPTSNPQASSISMAWVEITTKCNLRCRHCYNESSESNHTYMNMDDYIRVIDELAQLEVLSIQLIGGEPLLVEAFLQMVDYAVGKFKRIEIFTNATLLTKSVIARLSEFDIHVAVSVYSYDANTHDFVTRVDGSHEKSLQAIELLKNHGVTYRVTNVLMACCDIGEKNTNLFTLSTKRDVVRMTGRGNIDLLNSELVRKRLITEATFSEPLNRKLVSRNTRGHNCFARSIYISSDLTVYPCVMERRISHGNLKNGSLRNILRSEIQGLSKNQIEACKDCEFRYACHDCRPDSFSKNLFAKPWYCTYDPSTGIFADVDDFVNQIVSKKLSAKNCTYSPEIKKASKK